jgi:predicted ABC-type ATPase
MTLPLIIALAGPNGAGKSTAGSGLVRDILGVHDYIDADVLARGISPKAPEREAFKAGRTMLREIRKLAEDSISFAFETTLATRSYAPWIKELCTTGWQFHVVFLWLPDAEFAVGRVRDRVRLGGHDVPADVIRRRYGAGLRNFFSLYRPLATEWRMYDNSSGVPVMIAQGDGARDRVVTQAGTWDSIKQAYENG